MAQVIAHCLESRERTKDVTMDVNITFESLILSKNVLNGLRDSGFKKPSPIQLKSIPVGRCGFDMVLKSKSGTGKTLVYSIIALEGIDIEKQDTQVLILAPTREIAVQIQEVLTSVGVHFKGLKTEFFIGGLPLEEDKEKCKNCHIAVGAPGRVRHLIDKGILKVNSVHLFVLDEVDKLMESSFISDVNEIFNSLPDRKQVITTSATYPKELYNFLSKYMLSPTYIEVETETPLLLGLKQFVKVIEPCTSVVQEMKFKNEELLNLFSAISFTQCLIFTNYQTRAESISNFLNQKGWSSMHISAAQTQNQRLKTVKDLKNFKCKILLTTDLTARGIDAEKVDLVINYDIPKDALTYLHRMGRTGRYGSLGVCIDLISNSTILHKWQNMLGLIGGCSLGIPKLPKYNGTVLDLLKLDISSEHCIFGTISNENTPELNTSIKNNILALKQRKTMQKSAKEIQNANTEELMTDLQVEEKIIDFGARDVDCKQFVEMDTSIGFDSVSTVESENNTVSAFTSEPNIKSNDQKTHVSRNYSDSPINESTEMSKKCLFDKNRALLCVTEIISNNKSIDDLRPDLHFLQDYLNTIKSCEKNEIREIMAVTKSRSVTDLLKNIDKFDCKQEDNRTLLDENTVKTNIENIFGLGYQYATKASSNHWSTYLPSSELSAFQDFCAMEEKNQRQSTETEVINNYTGSIYGMADESDEYDMKIDESDELVATKYFDREVDEEDPNYQFMKWIPVEKSGDVVNRRSDSSNLEHFASHFNQCSEHLWQNGLCFENIEDFDNWFYGEWQTQVLGVRNYIQQNIYIRGMHNYTKSKCSENKNE